MATMLAPHFSLDEFIFSRTAARIGLSNQPDPASLENLSRMANVMESVRTILGDRPILITSGFRAPPVNSAVGGASNSGHLTGLAVDFICPGFGTPREICRALVPRIDELSIDLLILSYDQFVHLELAGSGQPRRLVQTMDRNGTRNGIA